MKTFAAFAFAAATSLAILPALAQSGPAQQPGDGPGRPAFTQQDRTALIDARVAGIKAGLKLTPEQEALFAPVEQAIRAMAAEGAERRDEMRERREAMREMSREERRAARDEFRAEMQGRDFMERLDRRAERATERSAQLQGFAESMRPFWASLDENQQRLLPTLIRPQMAMMGGKGEGRGRGGEHGMGEGRHGERRGGEHRGEHRGEHGGEHGWRFGWNR